MQFKAPKGDIRWWSILWLALGLFLAIVSPFQGKFRLRNIGLDLSRYRRAGLAGSTLDRTATEIFQLLGAVARVVALFSAGITFTGVIKVATRALLCVRLLGVYRSEQETVQVELGLPRSPTSPFDRPPADDHLSNPYRGSHQDER